MSEPTGTKRRRAGTRSSSRPAARRSNDSEEAPSFTRLNALIAEAVEMAKLLKAKKSDNNAVQEAHALTNSLLKALPKVQKAADPQSLGYDMHKKLLETSVRALRKHAQKDPIDGWEEQSEMMEDISSAVVKWLLEIWKKLNEEEDVDLGLIEKCLDVCSDAISGMEHLPGETSFCDIDPSVTITDSNRKTVCKENLSYSMVWIWRELLVTAASQKHPTKSILESMRRAGVIDQVFGLIRKGKEKKNAEGDAFWDGHWTDAMKEAATKVRLARC
ncbi:hypothetical protein CPC08DRAFT_817866 [Agrocybe pediades]|nr:hypothetical protein CPC08DRAFT_817866 [Agrocybe pediades]